MNGLPANAGDPLNFPRDDKSEIDDHSPQVRNRFPLVFQLVIREIQDFVAVGHFLSDRCTVNG